MNPTTETKQIDQTPWALEFKKDCLPSSYATALKYVTDPDLRVEIVHTSERGPWEWAITAASHDPDFWLDRKSTKKAALILCREMGWKQIR